HRRRTLQYRRERLHDHGRSVTCPPPRRGGRTHDNRVLHRGNRRRLRPPTPNLLEMGERRMTRPPDPCPACQSPTRKAYRPNLLDPGDVEPFSWCTNCSWDTDTITAAVCNHTTTDYCPQCGANRKEQP